MRQKHHRMSLTSRKNGDLRRRGKTASYPIIFIFWSILVGRAGKSKNGRRHIKLILCCFCPIISPHTKFHPNWTKNKEVRNFHFQSILVGRAGRSVTNSRLSNKHSKQRGLKTSIQLASITYRRNSANSSSRIQEKSAPETLGILTTIEMSG